MLEHAMGKKCEICKAAFQENSSTDAIRIQHPNLTIFNILEIVERTFSKYCEIRNCEDRNRNCVPIFTPQNESVFEGAHIRTAKREFDQKESSKTCKNLISVMKSKVCTNIYLYCHIHKLYMTLYMINCMYVKIHTFQFSYEKNFEKCLLILLVTPL